MRFKKNGLFILIKRATYQEEIIIINFYASNVSAPNFIKHILKDLKISYKPQYSGTRDFNTLLPIVFRPSRQRSQQRNPRTK
jgi:hypothetical protein